jgi:hypothetical protein
MLGLVYRSKTVGLELTQHAVSAHVVMTVTCSLGSGAVPVRAFFSHET